MNQQVFRLKHLQTIVPGNLSKMVGAFLLLMLSLVSVQAQVMPFEAYDKGPVPLNVDEVVSQLSYPNWAISAQFEGKVVIGIKVDESGNYAEHMVLKSAHPYFTEQIEPILSALKFTPAQQNQQNVSGWVSIPFAFKLYAPKTKQPLKENTKFIVAQDYPMNKLQVNSKP